METRLGTYPKIQKLVAEKTGQLMGKHIVSKVSDLPPGERKIVNSKIAPSGCSTSRATISLEKYPPPGAHVHRSGADRWTLTPPVRSKDGEISSVWHCWFDISGAIRFTRTAPA